MDWWSEITHWLEKPVSNGTVLGATVIVVFMLSSIMRAFEAQKGQLSYLGSVLEAIANRKPWPW
jgi:hypothetical protein